MFVMLQAEAVAAAKDADYVVLGLGIETCGLTPAHNVNPAKPGRCFQEKHTDLYVFPDQCDASTLSQTISGISCLFPPLLVPPVLVLSGR